MTPAEASVTIEQATDEDLRVAVSKALKRAKVTADELREQARTGRFKSEDARIAWLMISDFLDLA